jgi:hypothetical protein
MCYSQSMFDAALRWFDDWGLIGAALFFVVLGAIWMALAGLFVVLT